ncbi:MAG: hypothetical protein WBX95_05540 [Xanthobacteraceae bacterium]
MAQQKVRPLRPKPWAIIGKRRCDVKKRFSAKRYGSRALALAAFAVAGTTPAFAQSSGAWNAGISARSGTPYLHTQSTNVSGYGAYAQQMKLSTKCLIAALLLIGAASTASAQYLPYNGCSSLRERGYYGTPTGGGPQYGYGGGDQYGYGPGYSYARQAPSCISRGTSLNGRSPLSGR